MTTNVQDVLRNASPEDKRAARLLALSTLAQVDSPEGYSAFYEGIFGTPIPKHARLWVEKIYEAREAGRGFALKAFRGSTKTTTATIGFPAFQIGHHPERANMIIQVSDDKADKATKSISGIIESNPFWKMAFPHIVPDKDRSWSTNGYEVKRDDMDYGVWRKQNEKRLTPSFVGCGYTSGLIVGFHPDGLLIIDDILNEVNTRSQREMEGVRQIIRSCILPSAIPDKTFIMLVFTPWREDDPVMEQIKSGTYLLVETPVMIDGGEDKWDDRAVTLTWKKNFSVKSLIDIRARSAAIEFARMYLVDLSKAGDRYFKYQLFPKEEVKYEWVYSGGCDYATAKEKDSGRDYFALCYVAKYPTGGIIVTGGVLQRCTQAAAEAYLQTAQDMFQTWRYTNLETDGKGEEFYYTLMRNPKLRMSKDSTHGKSKDERYKKISPWLENGLIRISDAEGDYLKELRYELDNYAGQGSVPHDDALDALYYAVKGMIDALGTPMTGDIPLMYNNSERKPNPFNSFGTK